MSTPASPAAFTISGAKPDSPEAFPSFILLTGSLSLCIKQGVATLIVFAQKTFIT